MIYKSLKNLTFIFIFINLLILNSFGEILKEIKVDGAIRVSNETIEIFSGVKIGDNLDQNTLNNILKDLYDTNFFKDIKLEFENSVLNINVIENPTIQNLIIRNIKSKDLKKAILDQISIKKKIPR